MKLNKVDMLPPGVHCLHDLLKHHQKLQGPEFLVMGWTVHAATTAILIHILHWEAFAVTESKLATVQNFCADQKTKLTRKGDGKLKLTQLLHLAHNIPRDQEELDEKNAQKTYSGLASLSN